MNENETYLILSDVELQTLRNSLLDSVKKIDHIIAIKRLKRSDKAGYIISGLCSYYQITEEELRSLVRKPEKIRRKRIGMHIMKSYTDLSSTQISKQFGLTNHATALHHIRAATDYLSGEFYGDYGFKDEYYKVLKHLKLQNNDKKNS